MPTKRTKFCCCFLTGLEILADEDSAAWTPVPGDSEDAKINKENYRGNAAKITVRITFDWKEIPGAGKDMPCTLQWWEYTDVPYTPKGASLPPLQKNKWGELSTFPSPTFKAWTAAMSGAGAGGDGTGQDSQGCAAQSKEVVLEDSATFPGVGGYLSTQTSPRKLKALLGTIHSERHLSGVVRVYSGCPEGSQSSKSWYQHVTNYYYQKAGSDSKQELFPPLKPPKQTITSKTTWLQKRPEHGGNPPPNPTPGQSEGTSAGPGTSASDEQRAQRHLPDSDRR